MRKEEIKSSELRRLITLKSNKLDYKDVTEEDFDRITELVFNSKAFNGEETGVDLNWIELFPELRSIRIIGFDITQEVLELLSSRVNINSVEFANCQMDELDFEKLNVRLKRVEFNNCGVLPFKYPKVPSVHVVNSELDFDNIDFNIVKGMYVLNSVIKNGRSLTEFENIERVVLDGTTIFCGDEVLEEIEVSKSTKYSHKDEVELVDSER